MSEATELPAGDDLLAELGYAPELKTALVLDLTPQTLAKFRKNGKGPPYIKVGRRFFYHRDKLKAWLEAGGTAADEMPVEPGKVVRRPSNAAMRRAGAVR